MLALASPTEPHNEGNSGKRSASGVVPTTSDVDRSVSRRLPRRPAPNDVTPTVYSHLPIGVVENRKIPALLPTTSKGLCALCVGVRVKKNRKPMQAYGNIQSHLPPGGGVGMVDLIRAELDALSNDLSGLTVVTGAGSGFEGTAATMAAMAGARRVFALTRQSGLYPSAAEAARATLEPARRAGVAGRIEVCGSIAGRDWGEVDILLNCRAIRPISRATIGLLPRRAVIGLMAASWELRPDVVDLQGSAAAGIKVVELDLDHPRIRLLAEFGRLCALLASETGLDLRGAPTALICDTPCRAFIERELAMRGAVVSSFAHPGLVTGEDWRLLVLAMRPSSATTMDVANLGRIGKSAPGAHIVQFSGTLDRSAAKYFGLTVWPARNPGRDQPGLPLEALGVELVLRKLAGGLKAAELGYHNLAGGHDSLARLVNTENEKR